MALLLDAGADINALGFGGDDHTGGSGSRPAEFALWHIPIGDSATTLPWRATCSFAAPSTRSRWPPPWEMRCA